MQSALSFRPSSPSDHLLPSITPQKKLPTQGSPARPRGLPGGNEPAMLRQPAWGKAASQPRPGAPGFVGTFAILVTFGYSGWLSFLMALFRFVSYPP